MSLWLDWAAFAIAWDLGSFGWGWLPWWFLAI